MTPAAATVFVVDDDTAFLKALTRLLRSAGFEVCNFSSARAFLDQHDPGTPGCVLLDLSMPGLSGLEVQAALAAAGCKRSIVFITAHGDIPISVQAMRAGAVHFLTKPIEDEDLFAAIREAIEKDRLARLEQADRAAIDGRLATLTPREHEVFLRIVAGLMNKQIAADLGTVLGTIKVHRARIMAKMGVRSLADLVRMAEHAGIGPDRAQPRRVSSLVFGKRH
jgi:FixJ family two-component response regulator